MLRVDVSYVVAGSRVSLMENSGAKYVPISVFAGAGCLFLAVGVVASNMILPDSDLSTPYDYAAVPDVDAVESAPKAPITAAVQPEPVTPEKPVDVEVEYVNLVEPARLVDVSDDLSEPSIPTTAPTLKPDINPIVRSTGWASLRPTSAPEILASLGGLQVAPPVVHVVEPQLSDTRASVADSVLPELIFTDAADRTDLLGLLGAKERMVDTPLAGPKLASLGPTKSGTLFPDVLMDPLPEQKAPALAEPEMITTAETGAAEPTETDLPPQPDPARTAINTLRPQPRPARPAVVDKPIVAEQPKMPIPDTVAPEQPKIDTVSLAGSKSVSVVGVFQTRTAVWALLALENGQIVKVTKGTNLSGLRVSRIRGDKIWIRNGNSEKSLQAGDEIMVN